MHQTEQSSNLYSIIQDNSNLNNLDLIKQVGEGAFATHGSLAIAYCEIANFLLNVGQPELAQTYFRMSLEISFIPSTYSLYLQCLLVSPSCSNEEMHREASKYNLFFSNVKKYDFFPNDLTQHRKLKIGYLCHFFHNSVSQSLLLPFISAHNRSRVRIFCYSDTNPNEVDQDIQQVADVWRDTKNLDDEKLSLLLREDEIDILLELNGHCVVNRYGTLARKPVPIQISFYNISATSGMSSIDYILVGNDISLDKAKKFYTETIYSVNGVTGIAKFSDRFPKCAPPPCLQNKFITFGSFGAAHKVNSEVIQLWCEVLKKIPTSRLYFKTAVFSHEVFVNAYKKLFEKEGISLERIDFEGFSEHHQMLECYSKMDIALDTFPHAGGTTTQEALWQGVPVLSLYGDRYAMQHGKMILTTIGHPELAAYTKDEFINKAVELASDTNRLVEYRKNLRIDFQNSPKADPVALAARLENAYEDMWGRYCAKVTIE